MKSNPIGAAGIAFVEISAPHEKDKIYLSLLLRRLGFTHVGNHKAHKIYLYQQHSTYIILNCETKGRGGGQEGSFVREHGMCACAFGVWVQDLEKAYRYAIKKGAKPYKYSTPYQVPAIHSVGDTLLYFCQDEPQIFIQKHFHYIATTHERFYVNELLHEIDHLVFAVYPDKLEYWAGFFQTLFNTSVQPIARDGHLSVCNLMNASQTLSLTLIASEPRLQGQTSQFLTHHNGEGLFQIAFATQDLCHAVTHMSRACMQFESVDASYYDFVVDNFPTSGMNLFVLSRQHIMIDGDRFAAHMTCFKNAYVKKNHEPILISMVERQMCIPDTAPSLIFTSLNEKKNRKTLGNASIIYRDLYI